MRFERQFKTQAYFRYFLHPFSVPSFRKTEGSLFLLTLKGYFKLFIYLYSEDGFTYGQNDKMLLVRLHVYRSIKT